MDTDDLSMETYKGVLVEAEKLHHDLTLQFALLTSDCSDEDEYLETATQLIDELMGYDTESLSGIFFEDVPDLKIFRNKLKKILENIKKIKARPLDKRTFEAW